MAEHDQIQARAEAEILAADAPAALKDIERAYLGKKGEVAQLLASIPTLAPEERPVVGKNANLLKQAIQRALDARSAELEASSLDTERGAGDFDPTLPPASLDTGSLHPITQVTRELEDLFLSMGYTVLDGPEVERDYYNFEALNIPRDHPARDSQDTFYCDDAGDMSLRPHTSPVQVRAMERLEPPFRVIAPGRVFRHETTDASHEHTFHQMEGMVVGKDISVGHLIGAMKTLLRGIFNREVEVRLRPGHFPFVEPGFELDARCPFCSDGCSVCGRTTWIELLPCGLVHPNVLRMSGIDPEEWSGFAFGLGLSRLVMLRYNIDDVRHLLGGDLRFLEQF
ncbi:MAG: phenylalanine--tRNA ligase subunit alpha [Myxococcota bacterium]|jgi:phenylalanyl-tRNA synthetase alpha chain|nr:phenylalanine--tRNA ligase subunit alpha [Myxococcota bacterium]